jgi:hypothetical protein
MTVDTVNDDRLARDGARPVCAPWWLDYWWNEHRRFVADLADVKRRYDEMEPLVAAIEPKGDKPNEAVQD